MQDRLYRSQRERVISGVCGGLGERFDVDPTIVRVAWVLLGILTGVFPFILLYVVLVIAIPEEPPGFLESMPIAPAEGSAAAAAWKAAQDAEWAARRAARRAGRARNGTDRQIGAVIGIVLIALGGALLAERWLRVEWGVLWPAGLVAVGIVVIVSSARR